MSGYDETEQWTSSRRRLATENVEWRCDVDSYCLVPTPGEDREVKGSKLVNRLSRFKSVLVD